MTGRQNLKTKLLYSAEFTHDYNTFTVFFPDQ